MLTWLFLLIINDVFTVHHNNYNFRNYQLSECACLIAVRYEVDAIAFEANQLWKKMPKAILRSLHLWILSKENKNLEL